MIENISALITNSKVAEKIRRRKKIHTIAPSASSIEEAKEKVKKILAKGAKKRKKNNKKSNEDSK